MIAWISKFLDNGAEPKPSHLSAFWHPAQFSKVYDSATGQTNVAMLITSPEPLYEMGQPDPAKIDRLAREIERYVRTKWATAEVQKASRMFANMPVSNFVVILEHAALGAYATRTQRVQALYSFDGTHIGELESAQRKFDDSIEQCVTI
ncbi:hypothetical protein [Celeribacter marinus]|uniref:Uncharacterized protein n=1 Tax=Celeribacter marinus TaxID=1397108 RepID=A0A0P0A887_9RHOB|nr:hypothetical protein [Celeribacter marinus]ALI54735.1 hypothetical protein IMCC12053_787 [Celeribacter marinus]SFK54950.1 hypothetical protein SAMN05444421_105156 [Celeribacter marinus]